MDQLEPTDNQDVLSGCTLGDHPDPAVSIPSPAGNPYVGDHVTFIQSATKADLKSRYPAEYNSHRAMLQREKKGFFVHDDFRDFRAFLLCVGPMPKAGDTLDRIDFSDREYAPGKVRWADKVTQNSNKSDTLKFACSRTGRTFTTSELARLQNTKPDTIRKRKTRYGWNDDEIIQGQKDRHEPATEIPFGSKSGPATKKKCVDEAKRNAYSVGEHWKHVVAGTRGTIELMPTHRDISRAKEVVSQLGQEKVERIISAVVSGWRRFSDYVMEHDGMPRSHPIPKHPNFRFVFCDHPQAAVNFAFDEKEQRRVRQDLEQEIMEREYRKAHDTFVFFTPDVKKWWAQQEAKRRAEFDLAL